MNSLHGGFQVSTAAKTVYADKFASDFTKYADIIYE